MKTIKLLLLAIVGVTSTLQAQENEAGEKPDEQIIVNREYDEDGNLIRFDSTYVFEWHGDTMMVFPDGAHPFFEHGFSPSDDFFEPFFSDSSFFDLHFDDDFFDGFHHPFDDEGFFGGRPFPFDSLRYRYFNDSNFTHPFPFDEFSFPGMPELFNDFEGFRLPRPKSFENQEQQEEWEELLKRHREEMEQFKQKWGSKNKQKPKSDIKLQSL